MLRFGFRYRFWRGRWWLVLLAQLLLIAALLMLLPRAAHGQNNSNRPPESLLTILTTADELANSGVQPSIDSEKQALELQQSLMQAEQDAQSWKARYEESQTHLDAAQQAQADSQKAQEDQLSASKLFTDSFNRLSQSSAIYQGEAEKQIAELMRQRNLAMVGGVAVALALLAILIFR